MNSGSNFNEKKYGITIVFKGVHRKNDCFGMVCYQYSEGCRSCEDWFGSSNPISTYYYKCEKCGYTSCSAI